MKIVIVNKHMSDTLGGSELQCDFIARGLHDRDHNVSYISPTNHISDIVNVPYNLIFSGGNAGCIEEAILAENPDVVYWRFNKNHFRRLAVMLYRRKIPIVFAVASNNDLIPWAAKPYVGGIRHWLKHQYRRIKARFEHTGFRYIQALTVLNNDYKSMSPIRNTYYVPNGMIARAEPFEWPRPYVAWIANIKPQKRPELFVEATKYLTSHGIDGLMVGYIQSSAYEWIRDSRNLPSNFYYIGPRNPEEVNGILAKSRVHIHTCQPEGFGNVFIQAWMQGRPSVSFGFDPGGFITSEGIGSVANEDMSLFVEQIRSLATQPDLANNLGLRAKEFAEREFSMETMINKVEEVLKQVVSNSRR